MSKLKVAISRFPHLTLRNGSSTINKRTLLDAREMAGKFYRENLPKMMVIPKQIDPTPRLNVWLWVVGYLRVNWSDVEKNLTRSRRFAALEKSSALLLQKLKGSQFLKFLYQDVSSSQYKPMKKMLKP